ncbi:class I SAM-dependent rRNA methyltransferase [Quatrionicoccus australiensis]|uniref:class I SAM-dependent rRNA methyltransferase n=1 Tax=Quatrionicoccus australiensis TaxID=138118 RepID=UPI001CFAD3A7|nr:class I SAM-dependent rRNA methyltransferase [Quatrionicoccus australiensis]MCB4360221.1 class I SAM-dependent rRNA methyltransferase [Quatrionicoccus australiensis]
MAQLILMPGKERSAFKQHHPWVFAGSVGRLEGRARPGDTVEVLADNLRPLGRAAYSPKSQIRARFWTFDAEESIDDAFFKRRVAAAVERRRALPELRGQQGLRLIHAESDGLPGVIADQYGDTIVVQLTSAGADKWRNAIVAGLVKATGCARVYERSDSDVRGMEGLEPTTGWLYGEAPATPLSIDENGVRLAVDVVGGHKTGFYLDQRDNRALLGQLAAGKDVLNCFCYTAGFSLQALAGGAASVLSIDSSGPALAQGKANLALNPQLPAERAQWQEADVFQALRDFRKEGRQFDLIVLDPPKFAPSASHAERAAKAYKDINVFGFKLLKPGGLLMTYSCSGGIGLELFQKIVAGAAHDAGREARIVRRLAGAADHPVALNFPEGEYLKGLLVQVD